MGIIGFIGLAIEIIKMIFAIISLIKDLKKKDPAFQASKVVRRVNEGISDYKKTGLADKLKAIKEDLERQRDASDTTVPGPSTTKGL